MVAHPSITDIDNKYFASIYADMVWLFWTLSHSIHFVFIVCCKYHHNLYSVLHTQCSIRSVRLSISRISALCAHKTHVMCCVCVGLLLLFNFQWREQSLNVCHQYHKLNIHFKAIYPMYHSSLTGALIQTNKCD